MNADREFLQECIIDSTSDDYENFAMISQQIATCAQEGDLTWVGLCSDPIFESRWGYGKEPRPR